MLATRDLHKLLGVSRGATRDEIRKAHRRLARELHPDANPGDRSAEERFKDIQQAYEVSSDPEKRQEYDAKLRASSGRGPNRSRARAGRRTGGERTIEVDLSDLSSKLAGLARDRPGRRKEGGTRPRGGEAARLVKLLGVDLSRISKLLGESIQANAKVSSGDPFVPGTIRRGEPAAGEGGQGPESAGKSKEGKGPEGAEEKRERMTRSSTRRSGLMGPSSGLCGAAATLAQ